MAYALHCCYCTVDHVLYADVADTKNNEIG